MRLYIRVQALFKCLGARRHTAAALAQNSEDSTPTGIVLKAHGLLYHSTPSLRIIKKREVLGLQQAGFSGRGGGGREAGATAAALAQNSSQTSIQLEIRLYMRV